MMKFKNVIYVLVMVIVFVAIYTYQKNSNQQDFFLLKNIEALSQAHGEIDETLVPYSILSSMDMYFPNMPGPTTVSCCKPHESKYSGCAKGLGNCR